MDHKCASERPSYIKLLNDVDRKYKNLCHSNDWNGCDGNDHKSAFNFQRSGNGSGNKSSDKQQEDNQRQPNQTSLSIWRPPSKDEAVGDDRFSRVIRKKFMGYCKHCKGKKSGKQGTWTTTHFSPDCSSVGGSGRSSMLMQLNNDTGGKPRANVADSGTTGDGSSTESNKRKLSFKEQLLAEDEE